MRIFFGAIMAAVLMFSSVKADTLRPIELDPIDHHEAELVIVGTDGEELRYSPVLLEGLQTYRITTTNPSRAEPADFDGVLLTDLLRRSGLETIGELRVTAENELSAVLPRALWEAVPVLVATRVNGQALTRRERGPIQFIIPSEEFEASPVASEAHLVWMAARIEPK